MTKYAPTNPTSLARCQWETKIACLKSFKVVALYRVDEQSILYNASEGIVPLLLLPKTSQYAVPIFDSEPLENRRNEFSSIDIRRAWSWDASDVHTIVLSAARLRLGGAIRDRQVFN